MLLVLVAVAAFTALNRPAAELLDVLPSLATALAGVGALWLLDRVHAARRGRPDRSPHHGQAVQADGGGRRSGDRGQLRG